MRPTAEQEAIFQCKAHVIKVTAFAGTGKTTTLRGFAEANPNSRILYIAFNKAIQQEAERKFPTNVRARTAHSIAYGRFGHAYGAIKDKLGDIKPFHILEALAPSLRSIPIAAANLYGGRVIEAVKAFLVSSDLTLTVKKHVSIGDSPVERAHFNRAAIHQDALRVWALMQDKTSTVPMPHDGYLKLFQLSGAVLPYDIVLLDEAQDTNPVTQAIVDLQPGRKVYVGDRHQAIYGFRGAADAMSMVRAEAEFHLTGSFRFGEAVADVANMILAVKDEHVRLRGLGAPSTLTEVDERMPYAFIARGNSALFSLAVSAVTDEQPFAFVGDLRNYRFDLIEDTYRLFNKEEPRDAFTRSFAGFEELAEYADSIGDKEVTARCRLVTKYGHAIPYLVRQISEKALPPIMHDSEQPVAARVAPGRKALVILSSGHRCKGMEFDQVQLADDFMDFFDEEDPTKLRDFSRADQQTIEEINLQYVAATRARKTLEVNDKLSNYLAYVEAFHSRENAIPSPC
ncbi:MAG: ATP-dependent helicase [Burkholderiaceae bacterium]|nr:MAG: ATP-dependent helicase [Burkholderiaceae bacterium]